MNRIVISNGVELKLSNLENFIVWEDTEVFINLKLKNTFLDYQINVNQVKPNIKFYIKIKAILYENVDINIPINLVVNEGAIKTETFLEGKIYILDHKKSKVSITPSMYIHEKNIEGASHGVVIKTINLKDIEYFLARGFTINQAKKLFVGM